MKKIGLILLVIIVILAIVSAFLPGKIHVERSAIIKAPVTTIFDQVNTLPNWKNWSHWDKMDPDMKSEYEGPVSGAGAVHKWTSDHKNVGKGSMTIVESKEPSSIVTSLYFNGMGTSMGGWMFDDSGEGVKTSLYMDVEVPFYGRIFPGFMMNDWMGEDFDKALAGLKVYTEGLPVETAATWEVDVMTTEPITAMSTRITVKGSEFPAKLSESFGKITEALAKQGLHQTGPNYTIYHKWSAEEVEMEPGIPVDKPGVEDGNIKPVTLPAIKVMKVDYYGDYPGSEKAHYFMDEWSKKNNLTIIGAPWEEYVTESMNEPDTSKWLTRIYYPIQ